MRVPAPAEAAIVIGRRAVAKVRHRRHGGGSTSSAAYCYAVWLRHLAALGEAGLLTGVPRTVAELGPGDSIGVGLAAILSGVEAYSAVDAIPFVRGDVLTPLDELARLLRRQAPIPMVAEMPIGIPPVRSRTFPASLIGAGVASPDRVAAIRERPDAFIRYVAPWSDAGVIAPGSVDLVLSQAVMEHVADIGATYRAIAMWLRPGGLMSAEIDLSSHGTAMTWSGHWRYSRRLWRVVNLRHSGINRAPVTAHLDALEAAGLAVVAQFDQLDRSGMSGQRLHPDWRHLTASDLQTAGVWLAARRLK